MSSLLKNHLHQVYVPLSLTSYCTIEYVPYIQQDIAAASLDSSIARGIIHEPVINYFMEPYQYSTVFQLLGVHPRTTFLPNKK